MLRKYRAISASLAAATLLLTSIPAMAGGSASDPGAPGSAVQRNKANYGDDWGQTVAGVAKGEDPNEDRKLGHFLQDVLNSLSGGPNPYRDNGNGN